MKATLSRRELIREYKQRKPQRGVFKIECRSTSQVWVGSSPNLDAARNSHWFGLRLGNHRDQAMQAAWNAYGEPDFHYEVVEKLDDDLSLLSVPDLLKEKKSLWSARLSAPSLL